MVSISHSSTGEITATFASGLTATGSIVIGTDGPHSAVRHILLGAEKAQAKQLEVIMYNMYVCYGDAERALKISSLHPVNTVAIQPDKGLSVWISSKVFRSRTLEKPLLTMLRSSRNSRSREARDVVFPSHAHVEGRWERAPRRCTRIS